jgi:hypothetical protein
MAKGKPYSDAEIRPETPEILRHLERMHYDSPEWHRDAGIKQRGLGVREVDDPNVSQQKQDTLPNYGK